MMKPHEIENHKKLRHQGIDVFIYYMLWMNNLETIISCRENSLRGCQ